jgi:hypothetical protein
MRTLRYLPISVGAGGTPGGELWQDGTYETRAEQITKANGRPAPTYLVSA